MSGSGGSYSGLYTSQNPTTLVEPSGYLKSVIDVADITKQNKHLEPDSQQQHHHQEDLRKIANLTFKSQVERSELINQLGGTVVAAEEKQPKKRGKKSIPTKSKKSKNTRW